MTPTERQLAVLIDGDNLSAAYVGRLLRKAEELGIVRLKRVYRDWSHISEAWDDLIHREGIRPAKRCTCTGRKNASDIMLTIDAMDMLSRGVRAFCLFSSDSDFTPLARRLRKDGAEVFGFGDEKTPEPLRSACDRFIVLPPDPRQVQVAAKRQLRKIMQDLGRDGGAVSRQVIGQKMDRDYGFPSLTRLIEATEGLELLDDGKVRLKSTG